MALDPCKEMSVEKCEKELIATYRVNKARDSLSNNMSVNPEGIGHDFPESLINDIDIGDITVIKSAVQATKGQYRIPLDQFHGKDRRIRLTLIDEGLEDRTAVVHARVLETQSHDTIIYASPDLGPFRHSAERVLGGSEMANSDGIIE
jgi:hypothetical protein